MTFLEPDPTGLAGAAGINGSEDVPALAPNKPNAIKSLNRKYRGNNLADTRAAFGTDLTNAFVKWEVGRAQRGIPPLTTEQTLAALSSAKKNKAATPAPDRDPLDILGNVASDVTQIVSSIPNMPRQIANDVMHVGDIGTALEKGGIPGLLQAPVVRLLPGAYTASNLIQGNVSELASHPVMTGLDVLPYAMKGLKVGVGDEGATVGSTIADSKVGEVVKRAKGVVTRSLPGQLAQETLGESTRSAVRPLAEQTAHAQMSMLPELEGIYKEHLDTLNQDATRATRRLNEVIPDPERMTAVTRAIKDPQTVGATDMNGALDALNATDAERGAILQERQSNLAYRQYGIDQGAIAERNVGGVDEVYTANNAARIDKGRAAVERHRTLTQLNEAITHPELADITELENKASAALKDPAMSGKTKRSILTGYVHALDAAGYDTGSMLGDARDLPLRRLGEVLHDENGASRGTDRLPEGTVKTRPARGQPALDAKTRWLEQHKSFTRKSLTKFEARATTREASILPARWQPAFQRLKMDAAKSYIASTLDPADPAVGPLLDAVHGHLYADLGPDVIRNINREAIAGVNDLKAHGYNPEYVHAVSLEQARAMSNPSITTIVPKVSQHGVRINDWTPSVDSLSVSISHQGLEFARQRGARFALDQLRDSHTVSVRDATAELRPIAERAAARTGRPLGAELERLMRKKYVRWSETEHGFVAGNAKRFQFTDTQFAPDELLIEKPVARALHSLAKPPTYSRIFDPINKVFRSAILPFSPRFLLHHIGGGMLMSILEDPRIAASMPEAMSFARDISEMQKVVGAGQEYALADHTKAILERMPDSMRAQINGLKYAYAPENEFLFKGGGKMAELAHASGIDRIAKAGGKIGDWTFHTVDTMDTAYRAAAYLSGEKNALTAGLSAEEAGARGMALVNKVMPRWLEMTPMERSALRAVFPFYAFMSHVMRYAARFPIDHPWRTATMAAISRAELEDFGTGLPQALASAFSLGSPDSKGAQTFVNIGAINPFHNVGDNLTLAGFLANVNPVFKTALAQLGYDAASRGPNLYPEVQYDEETGKFKSVNPSSQSLVGGLVTSVIPQANILAALTGTSGDFRNLLESNPEAATKMLASNAGIPLLWHKYNVREQAFQAELNRETDAKKVMANAMRTGDYSRAWRYPSLRGQIVALKKLAAAGKLTPYEPGVEPSLEANNARQQGSQGMTQAEVG